MVLADMVALENKTQKQEIMTAELKEYISASEYAKFIGKTTQTVYNMINEGKIASNVFTRGGMIGHLIEKPDGFDEWKDKQLKTEE